MVISKKRLNEAKQVSRLYTFKDIKDKMIPGCVDKKSCETEKEYYENAQKLANALGVFGEKNQGNICIYTGGDTNKLTPEKVGKRYILTKKPVSGLDAEVYVTTEKWVVLVDRSMSRGTPALWFKNKEEALRYIDWAEGIVDG